MKIIFTLFIFILFSSLTHGSELDLSPFVRNFSVQESVFEQIQHEKDYLEKIKLLKERLKNSKIDWSESQRELAYLLSEEVNRAEAPYKTRYTHLLLALQQLSFHQGNVLKALQELHDLHVASGHQAALKVISAVIEWAGVANLLPEESELKRLAMTSLAQAFAAIEERRYPSDILFSRLEYELSLLSSRLKNSNRSRTLKRSHSLRR